MISKALLTNDIDTKFQPGEDDWRFTNYGSYIAQAGHCEGQSLTALWYYVTKPDGANVHLYGSYDNNGNQPQHRFMARRFTGIPLLLSYSK